MSTCRTGSKDRRSSFSSADSEPDDELGSHSIPCEGCEPFSDAPERRIGTVIIGNFEFGGRGEAPFAQPFWEDLCPIARRHGFALRIGWNPGITGQWLRDPQIALCNGGFFVPKTCEDVGAKGAALINVEDFAKGILPPDGYVMCRDHPNFDRVPFKVFAESEHTASAAAFAKAQGLSLTRGRCFLEGGNILVVPRRGRPGVVVGEANVYQTVLVLEMQGVFKAKTLKARMKQLAGTHSVEELEALDARLAPLDVKLGRPAERAEELLAKLDIARDVIAADLCMSRADVLFVEQPAFHLDVAMAAGPRGTILLQDHRASVKVLRAILEAHADELDEEETARIRLYLKAAAALADALAGSTARIARQLEAGGYSVVLLAGVFLEGHDQVKPINFFNHIAGTDPEGRMFYVTNAAPGTLGRLLQRQFAEFLLGELGYDCVYFIGKNGAAHQSLAFAGALRCLTTVLPTAPPEGLAETSKGAPSKMSDIDRYPKK